MTVDQRTAEIFCLDGNVRDALNDWAMGYTTDESFIERVTYLKVLAHNIAYNELMDEADEYTQAQLNEADYIRSEARDSK